MSRAPRRNVLLILNGLCGGGSVTLLAMEEEPPLAAKCKDKFMVQSVTITPERKTLPLSDIVSDRSLPLLTVCHCLVDTCIPLLYSCNDSVCIITTQWKAADVKTHSQKIKVAYLPPEGPTTKDEEELAPALPVQPSTLKLVEVGARP